MEYTRHVVCKRDRRIRGRAVCALRGSGSGERHVGREDVGIYGVGGDGAGVRGGVFCLGCAGVRYER